MKTTDTHTLRVFFTINELKSVQTGQYSHEKRQRDFGQNMRPQTAYQLLLEELGSVKDSIKEEEIFVNKKITLAPQKFVTIHGHSMVPIMRRVAELPGFRATEQCLFDPMEMKAALSRKPGK